MSDQEAENRVAEQLSQAARGDYETEYREAVEQYGGSRTKEVVHEQEAIRDGEHAGSGHPGDSPAGGGLSGKEGDH